MLPTMSEDNDPLQKKVEMAAGIVVGSQNTVGIAKAMEIEGFSEEECHKMTIYQRVRRRSHKLCIVEKNKITSALPPSAVNVEASNCIHGNLECHFRNRVEK